MRKLLLEEKGAVNDNERNNQHYDRRACVEVLLKAAQFIKANHKSAWEGIGSVEKGGNDE